MNYICPFVKSTLPRGLKPVHNYTLELHRAIFTEEFYGLLKKYEKIIHKNEENEADAMELFSNSPLIDDEV
jgi:hypothetical protein